MGERPVAWAFAVFCVVALAGPANGQEPAPPTPAPGAPTVSLGGAVALALEQNFTMLGAADTLTGARLGENVARAQFFPKVLPSYGRNREESAMSLSASQRLPFTGGTFRATGALRSSLDDTIPLPRAADMSFEITQPLLRGFGPNAAHYDLRNSRRARESQERSFEMGRQRLAVDVASAFYQVVLQRQLLAVARQSLGRSESLLQASEARLQVGLVSKLDVFRAELKASEAREAMVLAETSLEGALEQFRALLGRAPTDPLEPEPVTLAEDAVGEPMEPVEVLVARARAARLDLRDSTDQVEDAERTASLARQNLLPQLDLNVAVTRGGLGTSWSSAWNAGDRRVQVFLSSSLPLERTSEAASKAIADLQVAGRRRSQRQQEIQVEGEVRAAVREIERLRKSVELQRKAMDIAEQQHQLATLRYQRGLASNFDVVDAEGSLVLARTALVGLLTSSEIARIKLLRATGSLDVDREFSR